MSKVNSTTVFGPSAALLSLKNFTIWRATMHTSALVLGGEQRTITSKTKIKPTPSIPGNKSEREVGKIALRGGKKNIWKRQKKLPVTKSQCFAVLCVYTTWDSLFPKKVVSVRPAAKWQVNNHLKMNILCFVLLYYPCTSWETICSPSPSGQTFKAKSSLLHSYCILWFLGRICLYQWCTSFALKTHPLMQEQKSSD